MDTSSSSPLFGLPLAPEPTRVLVVGRAAVAEVARSALADENAVRRHEILGASDLAAANRALAQADFDLLIVELQLPDSEGLATLRGLVQTTESLIVAIGPPSSRDAALRLGAYEFLSPHQFDTAGARRLLRLVAVQSLTQRWLRAGQTRLRSIIDTEPECVKVLDAEGMLLDMNPAGLRMIEADRVEDVRGRCMYDLVAGDDREAFIDFTRRVAAGHHGTLEFRVIGLRGRRLTLESHAVSFSDPGASTPLVLAITRDVTERRHAEDALRESEARFRSLVRLSSDWYWEQDAQLRFTDFDGEADWARQHDVRGAIGLRRWDLPDATPLSSTWQEHIALLESHQPFRNFEYARSVGSALRYISVSGEPVFDAHGAFRGYRGIASDITARKHAELRAAGEGLDPICELPTRPLVHDRLSQMIVQARRHRSPVGVLFLDLDQFKLVNDDLGHRGGDELLRQSAQRIVEAVRPGDTAGRISGDEFAVLLADLARPDDAALVAQKIAEAFARPFRVGEQEALLSASIGIATYPADGAEADALLSAAEAAMHRAKQAGGNGFQFFTAEINKRTKARARLAAELRRALEREEYGLVYQPKFDLQTGRIAGAEALLRWRHPERGIVGPVEFIPMLEETGLIVPVSEWVVSRACEDLKRLLDAPLRPGRIAVNLSARQFRQPALDRRIRELVARAGISPALLELEITESQLMHNPDEAIRVLRSLRDEGVRVTVDDFGTGYSSLAYLTRFPVESLKIDRSFVAEIFNDRAQATIVRAVIEMAHTLGFTVIAEGVETQTQADFLRQHGCDEAQGYLFARPMPSDELAGLLKAGQTVR